MLDRAKKRKKIPKIGLMGASFDTGNLGVNALAEASIKCIMHRWPKAEVKLLGSGYKTSEQQVIIAGRVLSIQSVPIRFCKNVFLGNHICRLIFYAVLFKIVRWKKLQDFCSRQNPYLKAIIETDVVADISGGDSFSDIYGMRRFVLVFLCKWLMILFGKPLVLLPQTYGPYKNLLSNFMAKHILRRAKLIYCRDRSGVSLLREFLGSNPSSGDKVRLVSDVAFLLAAKKPKEPGFGKFGEINHSRYVKVGLNVSGLLFNSGYASDNMFGLKADYRQVVFRIGEMFLRNDKVVLLLVPHVFPPPGLEAEDDPEACGIVYGQLHKEFANRVFFAEGDYDQGEVKHIIGLCDFFVGSRMHSCIAAMSQCIPTVGVAYSGKFSGVFETIGMEEMVADMRKETSNDIIAKVATAFERRQFIQEILEEKVPRAKTQIRKIFNEVVL